MKTCLTVDLAVSFVLEHKEDDPLPIELIKRKFETEQGVDVRKASFTSLSLVLDNGVDSDAISEKIRQIFSAQYPEDGEVLSLSKSEEDSEDADENGDGESEDEDGEEDGEEEEEVETRHSRKEEGKKNGRTAKTVMADIEKLIGAEEFKALCRELVEVAPELVRSKTVDVFTHRTYLFSINDGDGLSTYLKLFAELLTKLGLRKISPSFSVMELRIEEYKESPSAFSDIVDNLETATDSSRILCIDVCEWMSHTESHYFKDFLRKVEDAVKNYVVVFRVPFVDKDVLENLKYSLGDLLTVRAVSFPPFTKDEVKNYACGEIGKYGFTISNPAWEFFHERIAEEKSDGKFYGLNTVNKVIRELVYQKQLDNARRSKSDNTISKKDALAICTSSEGGMSGEAMLNKLVGNQKIKERIAEIVAQIELSLKNGEERPCIHMRFVGNPGTGKTTVARIIGKMLKEKGVLRIGNFYEVAGRDFCGRYIGETAPKTASICRDAYGSVLFVDEAYSLYRGDDNSRDYGREALDTLVAEMENHRSDFVVIMAGYPDEMNTLMNGNTGLRSRMPYLIEFPNFTREELFEIYMSMLEGKFRYEKTLPDAVREYFNKLPDEVLNSKEFSNARFVRNLFERTWAKAAMRCQLEKKPSVTIMKSDFDRSVGDNEFSFNQKQRTRLGF